jgi:hypothetical protein
MTRCARPSPGSATRREGFTHGFSTILLVGSTMALIGAVLALLLVRDSDLRHEEATGLAAEPAIA